MYIFDRAFKIFDQGFLCSLIGDKSRVVRIYPIGREMRGVLRHFYYGVVYFSLENRFQIQAIHKGSLQKAETSQAKNLKTKSSSSEDLSKQEA